MKRICSKILILSLCLLFLLAGCQPTPETPVVVGKNDGDDKVSSLFGKTSETAGPYEAPESWKEDAPITSGSLSVTIDADVSVPEVTKFPVVKVADHIFTQEEADEILAELSEGGDLYSTELTRADMEEYLLAAKARLAELKALKNPSEAELIFIDKYENQTIPQLEEEIAAMPEGETPAPFTTDFQLKDGEPVISVRADLGGESLASITIRNGSSEALTSWNGHAMPSSTVDLITRQSNMYDTLNTNTREVTKEDAIPNGISMTREEALTQAEEMMRKVGLTDMQLALAIPASAGWGADSSTQCWVLHYYPLVDGIPVAARKKNAAAATALLTQTGDSEEYNAIFYSPIILFYIDETGVWMQWYGPIDIQETLNENAVLLSFDQIQERIMQQLPIKYAAKEGVTEVHVTSIELNYMRARIKDTQDGFMLIPVWDVIGYTDEPLSDSLSKGPKANPEDFLETLLTISAIDGSVLNRGVGY